MADLDNLSIQISASTTQADKAIDKLINKLGDLNKALNNYSANSDYIKGLSNLSSGLTSVGTAIASIDLAKMKDMTAALKTLAGAGSKMAGLNVAKSLASMSASAESASVKFRGLAESLAKEFNISDQKTINNLATEIANLNNSIDDPVAYRDAESRIENIITAYFKVGKAVDETYQKVREFVSGTDIYLSKLDISEYADEFARMHGVLGIKNTTTDPFMGVGLDTLMGDIQELFPGVIKDVQTTQEAFRELVDYLTEGKEAAEKYAQQMQNDSAHVEQMDSALERLHDTLSTINSEQSGDLGGLSENNLSGVAEKVTEISSAVANNPFEGLVNGLQSLEGVSITEEEFGGLKTISESLGKLGGKYAASAATNLPQIADGIQKIASISIPDIGEELASLAAGVAKFGTKAATRAQNLPQFVEGLRQLATIPAIPQIEGLDSLAQSLSLFGRKTAQQAVTTIPQLAAAFRSLIETLAGAPNVSQNTIELAYALGTVTSNGSGASSMFRNLTTSTNLFSKSANRASKSTKGLASFFGKLYAKYFLLIRAIRSLGTAISYSSSLTEVENVVETTFGNATDAVQEFSDQAIMSFGMSELSAKQFASRFQAMGAAMGITTSQVAKSSEYLAGVIPQSERVKKLYGDLGDSMADVSVNLTKLTADMASFYNEDYEDVAEDMQAVFTGMTRPLRKYGLDLTQATLKEFALANGLDADISKMTQAQKTMLRYQYVMANMGHVMGDFDKTMNNWANVTRTIGQQFQKLGQIIGEGLINTFKPYLIAFRDFMNTLIDLTEKALNAVGKLLGWEVQIERVGTTISDDMSDYADSVDDAAGSAKELKKMLLGIDELNLLPSNSDGGSGSGTSGGGAGANALTDYTGAFEVKKYESDIESWFDFGRRISEKIREGLNSIDWTEKFESARNFGKNLADFLNGLITPETFKKVGQTIANAMNTVIYGALDFAKNFDWVNAGASLAASINGWLETFDFKATGQAITAFAGGILDWATKAIEDVEWDLAGQKLVELFMGIDWTKLETDLYELTRAIFNAIVEATKGAVQKAKEDPEAFGELAVSFTKIALFIGGVKLGKVLFVAAVKKAITGLATGLAGTSTAGTAASVQIPTLMLTFQKLTAAMSTGMKFSEALSYALFGSTAGAGAISFGGTAVILAVTAVVSFKLGKTIGKALHPEDSEWYDNFKWFGDDEYSFSKGVKDWWSMRHDAQKNAYKDHNYDAFNVSLKIPGLDKKGNAIPGIGETGKNLVDGIYAGADEEMQKASVEKSTALFIKMRDAFNKSAGIESPAKGMYDSGKYLVLGIYEGFNLVNFANLINGWYQTNIAPWFTKEKWLSITRGVKEGILGTLTQTGTDVSGKWNEIKINAETTWDNLKTSASTTWDNIKLTIGGAIDAIKGFFNFEWKLPDIKTPHISWTSEGAIAATGAIKSILEALSLPTSIPKLKVDWYAQGGFPETGSLFVAREAGAELVGNIGGHTAVANNAQIVEAVAQGVASAVSSVLGNGNRGGQTIQMVVDGKVLYQTVVNENNRQIQRTGASALRA